MKKKGYILTFFVLMIVTSPVSFGQGNWFQGIKVDLPDNIDLTIQDNTEDEETQRNNITVKLQDEDISEYINLSDSKRKEKRYIPLISLYQIELEKEGYAFAPVWSGNGLYLAYLESFPSRESGEDALIKVIDFTKKKAEYLTVSPPLREEDDTMGGDETNKGFRYCYGVAWHPEKPYFVFIGTEYKSSDKIYWANVTKNEGGNINAIPITQPQGDSKSLYCEYLSLVKGDNSTYLVYADNSCLYWIDISDLERGCPLKTIPEKLPLEFSTCLYPRAYSKLKKDGKIHIVCRARIKTLLDGEGLYLISFDPKKGKDIPEYKPIKYKEQNISRSAFPEWSQNGEVIIYYKDTESKMRETWLYYIDKDINIPARCANTSIGASMQQKQHTIGPHSFSYPNKPNNIGICYFRTVVRGGRSEAYELGVANYFYPKEGDTRGKWSSDNTVKLEGRVCSISKDCRISKIEPSQDDIFFTGDYVSTSPASPCLISFISSYKQRRCLWLGIIINPAPR